MKQEDIAREDDWMRDQVCTASCSQARVLYEGDRISYTDFLAGLCNAHVVLHSREKLKQIGAK